MDKLVDECPPKLGRRRFEFDGDAWPLLTRLLSNSDITCRRFSARPTIGIFWASRIGVDILSSVSSMSRAVELIPSSLVGVVDFEDDGVGALESFCSIPFEDE